MGGSLVAGILAGDVALVGRSLGSDAIIEPVRGPLIPGFQAVKEAAGAAGERSGGAAAGREGYCGLLAPGFRRRVGAGVLRGTAGGRDGYSWRKGGQVALATAQ